ncbi:MAG: alpha/beta fold hydrolase, partial [bacterium]|nr:alpha/beta fold hydrolase [bacterium]
RPERRGRAIRRGATVKDFGRRSGVATVLVDSPFVFALDAAGVGEGPYLLAAALYEGEENVHELWTPVYLVAGMDAKRIEIERALRDIDGHESAKASVRYPFDFARRINLGQMPASNFDFSAALRTSVEILDSLKRGQDPVYQAKGALYRHYVFEEAGVILPYRLFVPASYDGTRALPLLIGLHGLGGNESTFFGRDNGLLTTLATKHGYIVATPLGYNRTTGYGRGAGRRRDPTAQREARWSEQDVLNVLELVKKEYRVDDQRIYLMGHSMGGNGAWYLGAKYPHLWAAVAPIASGQGATRADLERMKQVPVLLTHGAKDVVALVDSSRRAARLMEELGMEYVYNELPDGTHGNVVGPAWEKMFPFFNQHRRTGR